MRIMALIWKELLAMLRDPHSRLSIILPPLLQLFIFAFAATLDIKHATIGVLNRDNGQPAFELLQRLHGAPLFKKIFYLKSVEEIGPFIEKQQGFLVVSLDEQFSRDLEKGKPAAVQLICDGRKSNTTQILSGYLNEIIARYNVDFTASMGFPQQNTVLVPRNWFNANLIYLWYNIPCMVSILAMLTCLVVISQSIAREREMGTFDQLLVSPLSPAAILIGKVIPGILIGATEGSLMWAIGVFILGVPFTGSFFLGAMSLLIFVASISGVGLFISSISMTQQQALLGTFAFMLPSVLLSGFATPIENMPTWLQPVTYFMPLRYMLVVSKGLFLKDYPFLDVLNELWPMMLIGSATLLIASYFFRRRLA